MNLPRWPAWRILALTAALAGGAAVVLAALGAHVLATVDAEAARLWDTALRMHLAHAVALLGIAALAQRHAVAGLGYAGGLMTVGLLLFCGSLYLRACGISLLPAAATPAGGVLLILGWAWMAVTLLAGRPCEE